MLRINVNRVLEMADSTMLSMILSELPLSTILILTGIAEMPRIGAKVEKDDAEKKVAFIEKIDLLHGNVTVRFTRVRWWTEDAKDWNWNKTSKYKVCKPEDETTTEEMSIEKLVYVREYALQA